MKKLFTTILACLAVTTMMAQGWPENYGGVMLQGFYWDYYNIEAEMNATGWATWKGLESHASELEGYIDLIWVPNSARTKNDWCVEHGYLKDMGYMPCWWLNHDNTIFGDADDLKSMIAAYKAKGIGIIEDVVINHKNGQNDWCDFPNEHVVGTKGTYDLNWSLADICYNDNGGYVRTMFDITGAADTGDDFDGCRDLDHTGANVQQNVKTYLDYLQKELGYSGFRYDMVKGYNPQYVGIYNMYSKPTFSVSECWDNISGTIWWVDGTKQDNKIQSAAFDFPMKFLINSAFKGGFNGDALSWSNLCDLTMAGKTDYKRYSITFVDNHDTYREESIPMNNEHHVLAANAFLLAMPGTPCIFLPHWKAYKTQLKKMIAARKAAGVNNQSGFTRLNLEGGIGFEVTGTKGKVLVTLGYVTGGVPNGYTPVVSGDSNNNDFCFYVSDDVTVPEELNKNYSANYKLGNARVDKPSGYYESVTVNVTPSDPFTTLVYSIDESGFTPITDGGQSFSFNTPGTHTLKVGVSNGNNIRDIQTYRYAITNQVPNDITIYVRADKEPLYLYAWDANGTLTTDWPGTQLSAMKSANGVNFYYMTFPKPSADYTLNYILNQGSDDTKTDNNNTGSSTVIFTALGNNTAVNLNSDYLGTNVTDPIEYKEVTVFVRADRYPLYLYAWYDTDTKLLGNFPGKQMSHTACINGKAWFCESIRILSNRYPINLVVSDGTTQSGDFLNVTDDIIISYDNGWKDQTSDYAGYPVAWFGQGEICAFFSDINNWGNIHAHAWGSAGGYTGDWPGTACEELGYNEWGQKIYKWTYTGDLTTVPEYILFNNNNNDNRKQTADCKFKNGAWYNTSNTGENIAAVSTDVSPSTEISIAALGSNNPPIVTNWNGKSEKVAQNDGNNDMSKTFSLAAGKYTVQAIVRGTENGKVTLSAKTINDVVTLTGLDNAVSTVEPNGAVDPIATGNNNGWHKAEVTFTLENAENVNVVLSSTAETWQLGALKVLSVKSDLPSNTRATTGVGLDNTYADVRGVTDFSFFDRGKNLNALIKANDGTQPASLTYNVIVDDKCANLKLTDGNYSFNNSGSEFTATNVSYDRIFAKTASTTRESSEPQYKISTIWLPFALTAEEATAAGTFWALDSYDGDNIRFVKEDAPAANTPYLFEAATDQPFLSLSNKTIPNSQLVTVTKNGISFVGVNERIEGLKSITNGVTYYGYSNNEFVQVGTSNGVNINPFRAYLQTPANAGARIGVLFDDENGGETGIKVVKPAAEPKDELSIYNLSGQRVKTPNKKGIYIVGGKKFVIK